MSNNHGHEAVITGAEFSAEGDVELDIRGQANHPHVLQLTRAELDLIQSGAPVSKTSSNQQGHTHQVTFSQAEPMPDDY